MVKKMTDTVTLVLKAMGELNKQLSSEEQIEVSSETMLFGQNGNLDSLGLVNLILLIEEGIMDELGVSITLADERAMSQKDSPFRSVKSLASYVDLLIREKRNG